MKRLRLWPASSLVVVVGLVVSGLVGIPLGALAVPFLWLVVFGVAFAVLFNATAYKDKLVGLGAGLVGFIIGWSILAAVIKGAFSGEVGTKTALVLGLLIVLTTLAALLLLVTKIRSIIPVRKLERPAHWERRPVLEPLDVSDEPWDQGSGSAGSWSDIDDDLGLYGEDDGQ